MNTKEYNGWTNYETWLVNAWLDNCESQCYWYAVAHDSIQEHNEGNKPQNWFHFEDVLKEMLDDLVHGPESTVEFMAADLLKAAISEVDTRAIAKHWVANQVEVQSTVPQKNSSLTVTTLDWFQLVKTVGRDRLDDIECQLQLDWIDYRENSFQDRNGYYFAVDGISVISAMRLRDMGVSIPEIDDFLSLVDSIVGRARKEVA